MSVHAAFTVRLGEFGLALDLDLEPGTVVALLGPNGSGKSTLLRTLAGLIAVQDGALRIDGRTVDDGNGTFVGPRDRSVGVVFQDYALFPHLTALENVAFGPRARGAGRSSARTTASGLLARLGVAELADRRPSELSGGQAQRVALARALATVPTLLLLDEPMAALDVETRQEVRIMLEEQLAQFAGCVLLVTHDPLDAMLLADRVLVLEAGRIVQDDTPAVLARRPATPYVASLMGVSLLRGTASNGVISIDGGGRLHVADTSLSGRALAVVRPESVTLHRQRPEGSARNAWQGVVTSAQPMHDRVRVHVQGTPSVMATVTPGAVADLRLARGTEVWMTVKAVEIDAYATPAR